MVQNFFDSRPSLAYPGKPGDIGPKHDRTYFNTASDIAEVHEITVDAAVAAHSYTLTINGIPVTYVSEASGETVTTIKDALVIRVNQSTAGVYAQSSGADTFTITNNIVAEAITVVLGTANLSETTTVAAVATAEIPLGLAVVRVAGDSDNEARLGAPDINHVFLGVTLDNGQLTQAYPYSGGFEVAGTYKRGDDMVVREMGSVWVTVEEAVTPASKVYYRYAGSGTIGAFRATSASGAAIALLGSRYLGSASAGGYVELLLGGSNITYTGTLP